MKKMIVILMLMAFAGGLFIGSAYAGLYYKDREFLTDLYQSTDGDNWTLNEGWKDEPLQGDDFAVSEDEWYGVIRIDALRLKELDLSSNGLNGTIPSPITEILIESLNLANNQLTGTIPPGLINYAGSLLTLDLSKNGLSGTIPDMSGLSALTTLNISGNQFSGDPAGLKGLTNLEGDANDFRWNALQTTDDELRNFLNNKQIGGDWESTQTIAPTDLMVSGSPTATSVTLTWTPVTYIQDPGSYEICYTTNLGKWSGCLYPDHCDSKQTDTKTDNTFTIENLSQNKTYYFRIRTATISHPNNPNKVYSEYTDTVSAHTGGIPFTEREALIELYTDTEGDNWTGNTGGWKDGDDFAMPGTECDWDGVTCNPEKTHVEQIDLRDSDLDGEIPESIGDFSSLTMLNLSGNQLEGGIPSSLTSLSNLTELRLDGNPLASEIPPELGDLSGLTILYLGDNLSGSIPSELGLLSNLTELCLNGNLTGNIPSELGDLSELTKLCLNGKQLTGGIPSELGGLLNLKVLRLNDNQLTGAIPSALGSLLALEELDLSKNQLKGVIPDGLINLTSLTNGGSDLSYNAIHTSNEGLRDFLNTKQKGENWENTQTIPPSDLTTEDITQTSITLTWDKISFDTGTGGYEVYYKKAGDDEYEFETISGKTVETSIVNELFCGARYDFRIVTISDLGETTITSEYAELLSVETAECPCVPLLCPAPIIDRIEPNHGPATKGIAVTIDGRSFRGPIQVLFDGENATITNWGMTQIECIPPQQDFIISATPVSVEVKNVDGQSDTSTYTYDPPPSISLNDSDLKGPEIGGAQLAIRGRNFDLDATVQFGGDFLTGNDVNVISASYISYTPPPREADAPFRIVVKVINPDKQEDSANYEYIPRPIINEISPESGPVSIARDSVKITGENLLNGAIVKFGSKEATGCTVYQPNEIRGCQPPEQDRAISVDVSVINPDGQNSLPSNYTYDPPPAIGGMSPRSGPTDGKNELTITGEHFVVPGVQVRLGDGSPCAVNEGTSTSSEIHCTASAHEEEPLLVGLEVRNQDGQSATRDEIYTYIRPPKITGIIPGNGPAIIRETITIEGEHFVSKPDIRIWTGDGSLDHIINGGEVSFVDAETLRFTTPVLDTVTADTRVNVTVINPDDQSATCTETQPEDCYTLNPPPIITEITPGNGPATVDQEMEIHGLNLSSETQVYFGDKPPVTCVEVGDIPGGRIKCVPPLHDPTPPLEYPVSVDVKMINPDDQEAIRENGYTFNPRPQISEMKPDQGFVTIETEVTLTGKNIVQDSRVSFVDDEGQSEAIDVQADKDNQVITFKSPKHVAGEVEVVIINPDGQSSLPATFTYVPHRMIISPQSGPELGGKPVIITTIQDDVEVIFQPGVKVRFGDVPVTEEIDPGTQITVISPAHDPGMVYVEAQNPGDPPISSGDSEYPSPYTYVTRPTITGIEPRHGPAYSLKDDGSPIILTISGSDFAEEGLEVYVGEAECVILEDGISSNEIRCQIPASYTAGDADVRVTDQYGQENEQTDDCCAYAFKTVSEDERTALMDIYEGTDGDNWLHNDNWMGEPGSECKWHGITCGYDEEKGEVYVRKINLNNNNLVNWDEDFVRELPTSMGNFSRLEHLSLEKNALRGNIPDQLGKLSSLNYLNLASNQLTLSGDDFLELFQLPPKEECEYNFSWNALDPNSALTYFLDERQPSKGEEEEEEDGEGWKCTQTMAPKKLEMYGTTPTSVTLKWELIDYKEKNGGYEVAYKLSSEDGEYKSFGTTANKFMERMTVTGLTPGESYDFRIRTLTKGHLDNRNAVYSEFTDPISVDVPDEIQTIQVMPTRLNISEPGGEDIPNSAEFSITLYEEPASDVLVSLYTSNSSECSVSPASVTLNKDNWNAGELAIVTGEADHIVDGDQTCVVFTEISDDLKYVYRDPDNLETTVFDSDIGVSVNMLYPIEGISGDPLEVTIEGIGFGESPKITMRDENFNNIPVNVEGQGTKITSVRVNKEGTKITFTLHTEPSVKSVTLDEVCNGPKRWIPGNYSNAYLIEFEALQKQLRAIIVAGGGPYEDNILWTATQTCANKAYRTLISQGYTADTIQYLSAGRHINITGDDNDIDDDATKATLEHAIRQWVEMGVDAGPDADPLEILIYMTDHGDDQTFTLNHDQTLTASLLDDWLDDLQGSDELPEKVNLIFIYDACLSGSFLSALTPPATPSTRKRYIVTGASADERAWFLNDGEDSFSYHFWERVYLTGKLYHSFAKARFRMKLDQTALIDGDDPDMQADLVEVKGQTITVNGNPFEDIRIGRGKVAASVFPTLEVGEDKVLYCWNTETISASCKTGCRDILSVWAIISPPYIPVDDEDLSEAGTNREKGRNKRIELVPEENEIYKEIHNGFDSSGDYTILIWSEDQQGTEFMEQEDIHVVKKGCQHVLFRLTDQSIEELRNLPGNPIPDKIISQLAELKDQTYTDEIKFMEAVALKIGDKNAEKFKPLVLRCVKPVHPYVRFKIDESSLEKLESGIQDQNLMDKLEDVKGKVYANEEDFLGELLLNEDEAAQYKKLILESVAPAKEFVRFQLTEQSVDEHLAPHLSNGIINGLKELDQPYTDEWEFIGQLKDGLDQEDRDQVDANRDLILSHVEPISEFVRFNITDQTVQDLRENGLPDAVVTAVDNLKGQTYESEWELLHDLTEALPEACDYMDAILEAVGPDNEFVLFGITDQSVRDLQDKGVPGAVVTAVENLKDDSPYASEQEFMSVLKAGANPEVQGQIDENQHLILGSLKPANEFVWFKLTQSSLNKLEGKIDDSVHYNLPHLLENPYVSEWAFVRELKALVGEKADECKQVILENVEPIKPFLLFNVTKKSVDDISEALNVLGAEMPDETLRNIIISRLEGMKGKNYANERRFIDEIEDTDISLKGEWQRVILENVKPVNDFILFRLTDQSLSSLQSAADKEHQEIPEEVINELTGLIQEHPRAIYENEWELLEQLNAEIEEKLKVLILQNLDPYNRFVRFRLPEQLNEMNVPEIISELTSLRDEHREYHSEWEFIDVLTDRVGQEKAFRHKKAILSRMDPASECVVFKLTDQWFEKLQSEIGSFANDLSALKGNSYESEWDFIRDVKTQLGSHFDSHKKKKILESIETARDYALFKVTAQTLNALANEGIDISKLQDLRGQEYVNEWNLLTDLEDRIDNVQQADECKMTLLENVEPVNEFVLFALTEDALTDMQSQGVPASTIDELQNSLGKTYSNEKDFVDEMNSIEGMDDASLKVILENVEPVNEFVLFTLSEGALTYMQDQGIDSSVIDELRGKTYSSERGLSDELSGMEGMDDASLEMILENVEPVNSFVIFTLPEETLAYMQDQGVDSSVIDELRGKTYSSERGLSDELSGMEGMDDASLEMILENVEPVNSFVIFTLPEETLAYMQNQGVDSSVIDELRGKTYSSERGLANELSGMDDASLEYILENVEPVNEFTVFTLTEETLTAMQNQRVPESIINALRDSVGKTYPSERDFMVELNGIEGMEHATIENILTCIKPAEDYEFKITEVTLEQLTKEGAPDVLTDALRALIDIPYESEDEFRNILIDTLKDVMEEAEIKRYEDKIVERSFYKPEPPERGDINGNGVSDLTDALIVLQMLAGIDVFLQPDTAKMYVDEYGKNGKIGLEQAIYIMKYLANTAN